LVLHQCDEGGDHDGGAVWSQDRRKLVTERLAASGGHDHAGVAARGEAADDGFLAGTEGFIAPIAVEGFVEGGAVFVHGGVLAGSIGEGRCGSHEELQGPEEKGRGKFRFYFATCQVLILTKERRQVSPLRKQGEIGVGSSLLGLKTIGVVTVEIAGDGEDLGDGCELMPATRVAHFPTQPVDAGGQGQAGGVVGGGGEADEGFCQWIGFIPPWRRSHGESLVHVEDDGGVNTGAEEDEFFPGVLR